MLKLILMIVLISIKIASPAGISFSPNQKYSFAGRSTIDIPSLIVGTSRTNWHYYPAQVTITFDRRIQFLYNMESFATIADLQMQNLNQGIEIFIDQYSNITETQMSVAVYAGNANNIKRLSIFYMYFYKHEMYLTNLQLYRKDQYFNNGLGRAFSSNPATTFYLTLTVNPQINITGETKVIPYISGTQMAPTNYSTLTYDISISGSVINFTAILLTFSSTSSTPTYVYQVYTRIIVYNPSFLNSNSSRYFHISSGTVTNSPFSIDGLEMTDFNTIVGITSFSISYSDSFNLSFSVDDYGVTFDTTLRSYVFTYFTMYSNYCHYKTPYYEQINWECWDICPGETQPNNHQLTCLCWIDNHLSVNSNCLLASTQISNVSKSNSSSTPMIIGIIFGVVVAALVAGAIYYFICVRKCCKRSQEQVSKQIQIQKGQRYIDGSMYGAHKDHQTSIAHNYKKAVQPQFQLHKHESQIRIQKKVDEMIKQDIIIEVKMHGLYPHIDNLQRKQS